MTDTYNMTVDLNLLDHRRINSDSNDLNELTAAVGWTERGLKKRACR
jgi:hypothetical protein